MGLRDYLHLPPRTTLAEARTTPNTGPERLPNVQRRGFEAGIPPGGINEVTQGLGAATSTDRRTLLTQLHDAYLTCPWAWASVQAIARSVTGGGLVFDWDADDGEGDQDAPEKPADVLACERLLRFVNPREDSRQLLRGVISDLLVFGDAYLEVCWIGRQPVALYSLDAPSMFPVADQHGTVSGYVQVTELGQRAEFEEREVIHISLDSPRSGIFGTPPMQAALMPIVTWLFTSATLKGIFRKGMPPALHVDLPAAYSPNEVTRFLQQFSARNLGPTNIGNPVVTKGGGEVRELATGRVQELLHTLDQKRDEIVSVFGVPPAQVGIIESGNLGGGTGETQYKTFLVNTCGPIGDLVLEKINFALVKAGFGITGWHLKFDDVDMRDSLVIEQIRDMRLRNGSWVLDRYRAEIGEPPVEGGNQAVLVDRQNIVVWRDMESYSTSAIAAKLRGTALEPEEPGEPNKGNAVRLRKPEPKPVPAALAPAPAGNPGETPPAEEPEPAPSAGGDTSGGKGREAGPPPGRPYRESWAVYSARIRHAMAELPPPA